MMVTSNKTAFNAITLFSGIGVDEFYLPNIGINIKLACELSSKRVEIYKFFHSTPNVICGDLCNTNIKNAIIEFAKQNDIKLLIATPPCQGVSLAGINKSMNDILSDKRNFLVMNAIDIFEKTTPDYFIIENVPRFQKMLFPNKYQNSLVPLEALLCEKFSHDYNIDVKIFNAADYGVPQNRLRIVYRLWKKGLYWGVPQKQSVITVRQAIGALPSIESGEQSGIKNHNARIIPRNHIECMRHTPSGKSAFDNPIFFPKKINGEKIKGFNNTFKRMDWDKPAPTITMRNEIVSSQENVHPGYLLPDGTWSDARVLTLRELLILSSLPPDLDIPNNITESCFRQLIGEGIPPKMFAEIIRQIGAFNE